MFDELKDMLTEFFLGLLMGSVEAMLNLTSDIYEKSITNIQGSIVETPMQFSPTLVETLRNISDTAVLPIAGLLLTYIFCYEIYELVTEKNRGNDFDTGQLMFLIIKTAVAILLVTNSFDIALAFFDLGQWMVEQIPVASLSIAGLFDNLINEEETSLGMGVALLIISMISMIAAFFMAGLIYLVAWSRMIVIMLYVAVAPIPFATLMNKDWVGSIGQNYLKQLIALMLQGFFMMVCLVIYGGLLEKATVLITQEGSGIYAILLMLVSMGVLALSLTRTHSLAKSVMGVV